MPPPPNSYLAPSLTAKRGVIGSPLGRGPGWAARESLSAGTWKPDRPCRAAAGRARSGPRRASCRHHLDEAAQHVGRDAVFPARRRAGTSAAACESLATNSALRHGRGRRSWRRHRPALTSASPRSRRSGPRCGAAGPAPSSARRDRPAAAPACRRTVFSTPTFILPNPGRYFATGSLSCSWPSSTSIMAATVTIGLVIE